MKKAMLPMFVCFSIFCVYFSCAIRNSTMLNCQVVSVLLEKDQRYRQRQDLFAPYFFLLDSLIMDLGYTEGLDALTSLDGNLQDELRLKARQLETVRTKPDKVLKDSLWSLQKELDMQNTKELLGIVNKLGFKAISEMDFECSRKSFIIFVHTPESLKEQVRQTIESGKQYIDGGQYRHIMWHLNGRKGR